MTVAPGFLQAIQKAFVRGDLYYRVRESTLDSGLTFPLTVPGLLPIIPWGLVVGPDSAVDRFTYTDFDEIQVNNSLVFSTKAALLNGVSASVDKPSTRQIVPFRTWPNTVSALIDFFIYLRAPDVSPVGGPRNNGGAGISGNFAYENSNGLFYSADGLGLLYGRTSMAINFAVDSAAVIKIQLYAQQYGIIPTLDSLIFTYTTSGVAGDGVSGSFAVAPNSGGFKVVLTKISGVEGNVDLEVEAVDDYAP